jgi:hypothetical protein
MRISRQVISIFGLTTALGLCPLCVLAGGLSEASHVEAIDGTELKRVTLTSKAAERLNIKTAKMSAGESGRLIAPYAALLYDTHGATWVYTNPEPLAYVRQPVVVESVDGQHAILTKGPPPGSTVVVVGAAELYGAEIGVGH